LPQLEQALVGAHAPPLVDLSTVAHDLRAGLWDRAVRSAFPGLSVTLADPRPPQGTIERIDVGAGEIFAIESGPADVLHEAPRCRSDQAHLSVMVLSRGSIRIAQAGRIAALAAGDMVLLDETKSFRMVGEESSRMQFLRIPRAAALGRYPLLEKLLVTVLPGELPGTAILAETLLRFAREAHRLGESQRRAMMTAIVQMLGVAEPFSELPASSDWRVRRALDFIELNLSVAGLTAEIVAQDQHISRRRLDQLMHQSCGNSIASHLWSRRLEQAAADLRDPTKVSLSVAQIAFANGFEDAAHFTRAFKKRFGRTPGQWRLN
jgi:AraC-like DNA-binding protein